MSDIHLIIVGYFAIGIALIEGIRWSRKKWKIESLSRLSTALVFVAWPLVLAIVIVMIWRKKT